MIKTNVVMMGEFRELREARRSHDSYKRYLATLQNAQLEGEINYLLDEFSMDTYGKDYFQKVRLVQNELVNRVDGPCKLKLQKLNQETMSLLT